MATHITDPTVIRGFRSQIGQQGVDILLHALLMGWRITQNSDQTVVASAPGNPTPKTIRFGGKSAKTRGSVDHLALVRQLIRFGDENAVRQFKDLIRGDGRGMTDSQLNHALDQMTLAQGSVQQIRDIHAASEKAIEEVSQPVPEPTPAPVPAPPKPHVITERPAMMHSSLSQPKGVGKSYPSKTTIERKWSDGTVDYACTVCGASSPNRLSFRGAHWAKHVRNGEAQPVDVREMRANAVEDPSYTEPAWTATRTGSTDPRVADLASFIAGVDTSDPEALAAAIIAHLFPDREEGERKPAEPLTPEQIIERIRRLVDTGHYADQERIIREQAEKIEALHARAERKGLEHVEKLEAERARAERAEASLRALHDIISDVVKTE